MFALQFVTCAMPDVELPGEPRAAAHPPGCCLAGVSACTEGGGRKAKYFLSSLWLFIF